MDDSSRARLFLALWPDAATARQLQAYGDALPWPGTARRVPASRLHLTLHFIGAIDRARLPEIADGLRVEAARIALTLDRREVWKGGIAVLVPAQTPRELADLHAALGERLQDLGLPTETRPYRPHLTLARKAGRLPEDGIEPLQWTSSGYALMESRSGYFTVRRYG